VVSSGHLLERTIDVIDRKLISLAFLEERQVQYSSGYLGTKRMNKKKNSPRVVGSIVKYLSPSVVLDIGLTKALLEACLLLHC
jgi:hypothetical protein